MAFFRQRWLILFAFILGGGRLFAASHEQRDFTAAQAAFQAGMWSRAEVGFAQFVEKYPDSANVPEAVLMQGEADVKQGKLLDAINLLQAHQPSAGALADQYAFWIGQAQFQNADYNDAADTFAQLTTAFPQSQWCLDAAINEAAARAKLSQWDLVVALLQKSGGVFQQAAQTNAADPRVLSGRLLLAQALLAQNHPEAVSSVLQSSPAFKLNPELDWRRLDLLGQAKLAGGDTNGALILTTNLIEAANLANRADLRAESVAEQAAILEKTGDLPDAESVYAQNLTNSSPNDRQRQAVLKIAELSAAQTNFSNAENALENFQTRFPNSPEQDLVLLALGELHLKNYVISPSGTNNDLARAQGCFDQFINTFTNSPLLGKAYLDRGWCFWIQGKWPESAADFQTASDTLPPSADLAIARFKLGDAAFQLQAFTNALESYQSVVTDFTNYAVVDKTFRAQALYQTLRISLKLQDFSGASNSLAQILKIYPVSDVAEKGILLVGEGLSDLKQPVKARALFQTFEREFPDSEQSPDVELAIARTYEQENNWQPAIAVYESWINHYSNNTNLAAVEYARAWANFKAGNETNAFILFTNYIARFPSDPKMTPVALWWLGDYYSGQGNWFDAEKNYKTIFQYWPAHELADPAMLMAARAAMGRQGYADATNDLLNLIGDTNSTPELDAQAWFAYGDVLMQDPSSDATNPLVNYRQAIQYFQYVCQQYPGSEQAALAWGEIGDCYLQLATQDPKYYNEASNAYVQVMTSPYAQIAERSQAQVGIGLVFEKRAALVPENKVALLQSALDNYLDVFFGNNLRTGETSDPHWVKQSGLQALPLVETLGMGDPDKFIDQMETLLPQLKDSLEKKRPELSRIKNQ
jgi:TolA-binding protein